LSKRADPREEDGLLTGDPGLPVNGNDNIPQGEWVLAGREAIGRRHVAKWAFGRFW